MYPERAISGSTRRSTESGFNLIVNHLDCRLDIRFSHFLHFGCILLDLSKLTHQLNTPFSDYQRGTHFDIKLNACDA
jgi:hypothetical protein